MDFFAFASLIAENIISAEASSLNFKFDLVFCNLLLHDLVHDEH
jgi:hypothetical protein